MNNKQYSADNFAEILSEKFDRNEPVNLVVTGNSMVPFLVNKRDTVILTPCNNIRKGDILLYKRKNGKFVLHRVQKISKNGIYFVGDSQNAIEGPLNENYVLAKCTSAIRKGKYINEENLIWKFFRKIWISIIPLRLPLIRIIAKIKK